MYVVMWRWRRSLCTENSQFCDEQEKVWKYAGLGTSSTGDREILAQPMRGTWDVRWLQLLHKLLWRDQMNGPCAVHMGITSHQPINQLVAQ
jgi:hypothetical protein